MKRVVSGTADWKKLSFWAIAVLLAFPVAAGKEDPKYPVSAIPEEMRTGMYAVVREEQRRFEITSVSSANFHYRVAVTLLNSNAKYLAEKVIGYDKFSSVKSFKGTAFDAAGNVIKKLKHSEIYDRSAFDGVSIYSDNRLKHADLSQGTYPYTVEFEYEIEERSLFGIPQFYLYVDDEVSVQHSTYTIAYPIGLRPRYHLVKAPEPQRTTIDQTEELTWNFKNVRPAKFEPFSADLDQVVPNISAAPSQFSFDGYKGNMTTWTEFGQWINLLNKDRDVLPEATKQRLRQLTAECKTDEEKARFVYEYLQSRTRYVSIQLGIGGLQPFPASVVDQVGYGDCKALSNYTVAMLREVGVKAHYVLVRAGDDRSMNEAFPSTQFNHAIVMIPNGGDTLWLECTSQTAPFGYQGTFTGDRQALVITENGSKIVNTIRYTAETNVMSRTADVYVDKNGDATAKVRSRYSGLQYEHDHLNFRLGGQHDEQREWLQDNIEIPTFDILGFKMENIKDRIPTAVVSADLSLRRFASVSGKRVFLSPNLMNKSSLIPDKTQSRTSSVVLNEAFTHLDTIRYHLPEGIYPEFLPQPIAIKSKFGEYNAQFTVDQGSLVYIRRFRANKGIFPPDTYNELVDFYRNVNKADNTKMVFLSKT